MQQIKLGSLIALALFIILQLSLMGSNAVNASPSTADGTTSTQSNQPPADSSGVLFIENVGQFDDDARFQVRGSEGTIWLAEDALWITRMEPQKATDRVEAPDLMGQPEDMRQAEEEPRTGVNIKLAFVGANRTPTIEPFNRLESKVSYFIGNNPDEWRPDVPVWGGVRYVNLYPGVDLEVTSEGSQLVQRLVAEEGADLDAVRLRVEGADELSLDGDQLFLETAVGTFGLPLFQVEGVDVTHLSHLSRSASQRVKRINTQTFDIAAPLVTSNTLPNRSQLVPTDNPDALLYSTFLGGTNLDYSWSLALDDVGGAYVAGYTDSPNFPTTAGTYDTTHNGSGDVFVLKLSPDGSSLDYSTFVGGSDPDFGQALALDSAGNVVVTGKTWSSNFPTTIGGYDTTHNGGQEDAFVFKLSSDGSLLDYSTFVGGSNADQSYGLALDSVGNAIVTGETTSTDFPTTAGTYDTTHNGSGDVFVLKLSSDGSSLDYSTFVGGESYDYAQALALDSAGNAYVTGVTDSPNFPTTTGAYDTTYNGAEPDPFLDHDVFILKLSSDGSSLDYSTFVGGNSLDEGHALVLDSAGNAVVTGGTDSANFPSTAGAYDTTHNGQTDVFVLKLSADGSSLGYSTFVGGSVIGDWGYALALDSAGNIYVTGETQSTDFPTTAEAYDTTHNGSQDAFVLKLSADGSSLDYSTFVGGSSFDDGKGLALDSAGNAYITSETYSTDFPTTAGAYDTTFNGGSYDAFVMKLAIGMPFSLTEVSPVNASHNTLPTAPITATFNQAVDSGSVNNNTFALHGTQSRGLFNGSYTLSNGDLTIELAHSDDFMPGELLQATVTTNTLSADGQNLDEPHVWQFRTAVAGGSGTFIDSGQSLTGSSDFGVALGDVDNDGDLDAFVTQFDQPNKVWLNQGGVQGGTSGQFQDSGQNLGLNASFDVALGDVDGDGDLDAFVANANYQGNRVWINQGNAQGGTSGQFQDSGQALGNSRSYGVALGDMDGDGDLDAFVGNQAGNPGLTDKVWVNQGGIQGGVSGQFQDSGQDFGFRYSTRVTLGDADNDGDLDAFVATGDTSNKVWINQGGAQGGTSGQFQDSGQNFDSASVTNIAVGDVDGDGDLDAFVANLGGPGPDFGEPDKVWINQGGAQGGAIGQFQDSGQNLGLDNSTDVALGDVDGDGDLDAFVTTEYNQADKVWINQGGLQGGTHGVFSDSGQNDLSNSLSYAVELGDVDNDGDLDAFIVNLGEANKVFLNQQPDLFEELEVSPPNASHNASRTTPVSATFNETVDSNSVGASSFVLHGTQSRGLFSDTSYSLTNGNLTAELAHSDEFMPGELLQATVTTDTLSADGQNLDEPHVWQFRTAVTSGTSHFVDNGQNWGIGISMDVALGDVDGDGDLDALVARENTRANKVWLNQGAAQGGTPGQFQESAQNVGTYGAEEIALGDLDSDGDLDAFVANMMEYNQIYMNQGGAQGGTLGQFQDSGQTPGDDPSSRAVALGDVDGDGDLDAFLLAWSANKVLLNQGGTQGGTPGQFQDSGQSVGSLNGTDVALGDLDNDGDLDAFVVNESGHPNNVWINQGGTQGGTIGQFQDSGQNLGTSNSTTVALGDVDGDGDLDAFVANHGNPNKVWVNQGGMQGGTSGQFQDSGQSLGNLHSNGMELGDLDGDGDLDAFVANANFGQPDKVWVNQGGTQGGTSGLFSDSGQSLASSVSHGVALGDLDGDGDLDAFVTNPRVWLNQSPNLTISKTGPATVTTSDPITYTLTVTNSGQLAATNLTISDTLPTNASYVSGGTLNGNEVSWNVPTLAPNSTTTVQFVVTASAGTIINSDYGVTSDGNYSATGNTSVTTVVTTPPPTGTPNLGISKSGATSVLAGEPITYTLNLSNTGTLTATNLIITDTLPTNASYISGGTLAGNVVSWNVPTLAPTSTISVQFVVTATQTITNSDYGVAADGGYSATGNTSVTTVVTTPPPTGMPNLSISKSGAGSVLAGELITYTLNLSNTGALTATNLIITDTLPTNASYVSGGVLAGDVVSWTVPTLAPTSTISVQFVVAATQTITNSDYGVAADGGYSATGSTSVTTVVTTPPPTGTPNLSISKSGAASALAGEPITYTLSVSNTGTLTATNLIITDTLPTNASYVSGGTLTGNVVSWNVPTLAPTSTISVQFVVTATQTITNSDYRVAADDGYSATGNISVTTVVTTPPPTGTPNLSISKSGALSVLAGEPITYTLNLSNTGALTATNLIITDTLPTNATYISGGTLAGNVVSWNVPTLPPTSTISVQFVVTATQTITNSDYGVVADGGYLATGGNVVVTEVHPPTSESLLAIYALSFDTLPASDLSWAYSDAMQGLRAATANDLSKRALVLVDMPGDHNTFVYELQGGTETLISGLPNSSGTLSASLHEYDMTDGATLGGFLLWARNTYSADKTTFSYVGHGASLVPETDFDPIFDPSATSGSGSSGGLFPLPTRRDAKATFTDATPNAKILSVYQLSEALRIGTNDGANPFDVADLVHCFAASIEEFYAVSPYADAMTGSPNYAFFTPEMLGNALDGIDQSTDAHTIADRVIAEYDSAIESYDDLATTEDEHPRLLVAVDSAKIAGIKQKWDEVSYYLWQNFDKTKIENAYLNSAHYDTTYCLDHNGTQNWALTSPDAVMDLQKFATELGQEFGSPVSVPVNTLKLLIDDAITSRYQQNGVPWFANVSPQPTWNFDNHAGIGIYADLVGTPIAGDTHLSWHAHFYTDTVTIDNPHPYAFLQGGFAGTNWADVFHRYWQGSTNLQTDACLPKFPPLPDTGELAVTQIIFPQAATVTDNSPVQLMAAISTTYPAVDTSVAFTVTQSRSTVFTEVVHIPGLLVTGTHPVEASQLWSPVLANATQAEPFTVEVMVDHDNHVLEPDELNNVLTTSGVVAPAPAMPRPIITATVANNAQWITDTLLSLNVVQDPSTSLPNVGTVEVQLYQYVAGSSPTTQVPVLVNSQTFAGVTLPQSLNVSLSALNPGPVVLHVWAWSTGGITVYPSIVQFNYIPPNTPLATGEQHDFLFHADAGDTLDVDLNALSGDANLFMWMPTNFGVPTWQATVVGSDVLTLNAPVTGEYLLSVYGQSGGDYTLSTMRNGVPYARRAQARANNPNAYVPESRPTFIEVIPERPLPPTAITLDHLVVRSRASGWSFLLISSLLAGWMGVMMRRGRD